jgi:hypothetical protein
MPGGGGGGGARRRAQEAREQSAPSTRREGNAGGGGQATKGVEDAAESTGPAGAPVSAGGEDVKLKYHDRLTSGVLRDAALDADLNCGDIVYLNCIKNGLDAGILQADGFNQLQLDVVDSVPVKELRSCLFRICAPLVYELPNSMSKKKIGRKPTRDQSNSAVQRSKDNQITNANILENSRGDKVRESFLPVLLFITKHLRL